LDRTGRTEDKSGRDRAERVISLEGKGRRGDLSGRDRAERGLIWTRQDGQRINLDETGRRGDQWYGTWQALGGMKRDSGQYMYSRLVWTGQG
jgi:hypothetical protein